MRPDHFLVGESTRDSLESSEISSDAFSSTFRPNYNFNHITQNIQNTNNKITIIIKHNENPAAQSGYQPQVIYIQPVSASQPNLDSSRFNDSHNNLQLTEIYNSLDDIDGEEHYQFYDERPIDVPEDFKRNSFLVLNLNDAANKKMRRRICTPTRNLLPLDDVKVNVQNVIDRNKPVRKFPCQIRQSMRKPLKTSRSNRETICFLIYFLFQTRVEGSTLQKKSLIR